MKKYHIRVLITAIAQVILTGSIYAQGPDPAAQALANSRSAYSNKIGYQSRLFNGIKYVDYAAGFTGNAYYATNEFQNATLHYDGSDFYNIPVLYDLYREMVVVKYPADTSNMSLVNSKLDQFILGSHIFVRIDADNSPKSLTTGFYELLYGGRSRFVKKYTKDIQEERSTMGIQHIFNEHTAYYLLKDNVYNPISGKRAMLNLFKDKKKELEEYIKTNKIDFGSQNEEQSMIKVASYYDQLSK